MFYFNQKRSASQELAFLVSSTRYFIVTIFWYKRQKCKCTAVSRPWQNCVKWHSYSSRHTFFFNGSLWLCRHSFTNYVSC